MGLDMYLHRCNRTPHTVKQLMEIDNGTLTPESEAAKPFLPLKKYQYVEGYSIFHEVGYWRKANAIHNWFVKNVQDGVDECQYAELNQNQLQTLLDLCKETLSTRDASKLEPVGGFFFGSTEIDEGYWADIENTVVILTDALENMDWENSRLFYHSSW